MSSVKNYSFLIVGKLGSCAPSIASNLIKLYSQSSDSDKKYNINELELDDNIQEVTETITSHDNIFYVCDTDLILEKDNLDVYNNIKSVLNNDTSRQRKLVVVLTNSNIVKKMEEFYDKINNNLQPNDIVVLQSYNFRKTKHYDNHIDDIKNNIDLDKYYDEDFETNNKNYKKFIRSLNTYCKNCRYDKALLDFENKLHNNEYIVNLIENWNNLLLRYQNSFLSTITNNDTYNERLCAFINHVYDPQVHTTDISEYVYKCVLHICNVDLENFYNDRDQYIADRKEECKSEDEIIEEFKHSFFIENVFNEKNNNLFNSPFKNYITYMFKLYPEYINVFKNNFNYYIKQYYDSKKITPFKNILNSIESYINTVHSKNYPTIIKKYNVNSTDYVYSKIVPIKRDYYKAVDDIFNARIKKYYDPDYNFYYGNHRSKYLYYCSNIKCYIKNSNLEDFTDDFKYCVNRNADIEHYSNLISDINDEYYVKYIGFDNKDGVITPGFTRSELPVILTGADNLHVGCSSCGEILKVLNNNKNTVSGDIVKKYRGFGSPFKIANYDYISYQDMDNVYKNTVVDSKFVDKFFKSLELLSNDDVYLIYNKMQIMEYYFIDVDDFRIDSETTNCCNFGIHFYYSKDNSNKFKILIKDKRYNELTQKFLQKIVNNETPVSFEDFVVKDFSNLLLNN